jgi:hypothetical protein
MPASAGGPTRRPDGSARRSSQGPVASRAAAHRFSTTPSNWEEEIDVPVGPDNRIVPGEPDQRQPTHFLPQRNRFVFRVRVPANFGSKEVVWTLVTKGESAQAFGSLKPLYEVDDISITANVGGGGGTGFHPDMVGNKAPTLEVEGEATRLVRVGESVTLRAMAVDDGLPKPRSLSPSLGRERYVPESATGLRLSWFTCRGVGEVAFDPPQTKVWEDLRDGGNSPWSAGWKTPPLPADSRWAVRATFSRPGTYVLRCLAHDGGLTAYRDVTFIVR